jgi:hypothetical protein
MMVTICRVIVRQEEVVGLYIGFVMEVRVGVCVEHGALQLGAV